VTPEILLGDGQQKCCSAKPHHNKLKHEIYVKVNEGPTSQEHGVSITQSRLMLLRQIFSVYSENHERCEDSFPQGVTTSFPKRE
jgi:hypothetical protein